ncbi:hypothetical protein SETIT_3G376300v2 [Setaria italica]|uniref:Uncharacterized protein n=1 Tax=Setaria italica TaxID=4555 RepID=A0A368QNN1_SETIT|nr:hypothetical protein SETIT_3G376300v2 [Setaria italica]
MKPVDRGGEVVAQRRGSSRRGTLLAAEAKRGAGLREPAAAGLGLGEAKDLVGVEPRRAAEHAILVERIQPSLASTLCGATPDHAEEADSLAARWVEPDGPVGDGTRGSAEDDHTVDAIDDDHTVDAVAPRQGHHPAAPASALDLGAAAPASS